MLKTLLTFPAEPFINENVAIRRCPYCKAIIDESQKYCNNCGTQLLFPEDELNEEPIKGEKILDEDFKEDDEDRGFDEPADDQGIEREEIDLDAVLKGSGHFPDEPAPPRPPTAPTPKPPAAEPEVLRRPPRPRKKSEPAIPKNDTREEIARLIAALEEKEKKEAAAPVPTADESVPESEPKSETPLIGAFDLPISKTPPNADFDRPIQDARRASIGRYPRRRMWPSICRSPSLPKNPRARGRGARARIRVRADVLGGPAQKTALGRLGKRPPARRV